MKNSPLKPFPFIKQAGFMECGTTSLAIIFKHYGYYDIRNFLRDKAEVNTQGVDLYTLSELAEGFGFETDGFHLEYQYLTKLTLPCIAHYESNHFVVVYRVSEDKVWISDPAIGKYTLTKKEFLAKWNGVVLDIKPTAEIFKHNELTALVEEQRIQRKNIFARFYQSSLLSSKKLLYQIIISTLLLQLLALALPFFTQTIIDQVLVNSNIKLLYAILIGMMSVLISQVVLTYGRNVLITQFKVAFERSFFSKFFDHFLKLKQTFYDNHKREDFINRFQENLKIRNALNPSVLEGVLDFAFVVTYLLVLFFYNSQLGAIVLAFIVLYTLLTALLSPKLKQLENLIFAENVKTMGQFLDTLLGMQSVRLLGIEKLRFWRWKNQYTKALNKVIDTQKHYIQLATILNALIFTSQIAIYWYGAYLTFNQQLTIGQYVAFITIFTIIINSLSRVTQVWFIFAGLSVTFDRLNDVLVEEPLDYSSDGKLAVSGALDIKLEHVRFKYRSKSDKYILKDINLEIKAGTFLGVVGRNGSGKTTFVNLISKLYENFDGSITLNDIDIRKVLPAVLRKKIAVIPQEVFLFDGTIKENILYGNPQATDQEIIEAAKMADLHDFIKAQFLGYNLKIGDNGVKLSGGQKLKVAFARLFVSTPDIIILDEASSALDMKTEQILMQNVLSKFKGKTIISIAHRLHTLRDADTIAVFDEGQIVEMGSHKALVDTGGLYSEFINTYINF